MKMQDKESYTRLGSDDDFCVYYSRLVTRLCVGLAICATVVLLTRLLGFIAIAKGVCLGMMHVLTEENANARDIIALILSIWHLLWFVCFCIEYARRLFRYMCPNIA